MRLWFGSFACLLLSSSLWASDVMPATPSAATADAERGRKLLLARHDTGCLLCHQAPGLKDGGEMGPSLKDVGIRLSPEQIRQRIADPRVLNPQTFMPSYFSTKGLHNVVRSLQGKTVLSEQALEDIIAYLLKNPS